ESGKVRGKRQTEFGYDVIEAPLPAVVAVSDAINEPRYPSLKGIMGAKKKLQETVSLADLGVEPDRVGEAGSRTTVVALGSPPLPQPRVDALAQIVRDNGIENVFFGQSVLAADLAAALAVRLDAGLNWQLVDVEARDGGLVASQPALQDTVLVESGWSSTPRL